MRVRVVHHPNLAPAIANPWRGFDALVNNQPKLPLFQNAVIYVMAVIYVTITLCCLVSRAR